MTIYTTEAVWYHTNINDESFVIGYLDFDQSQLNHISITTALESNKVELLQANIVDCLHHGC